MSRRASTRRRRRHNEGNARNACPTYFKMEFLPSPSRDMPPTEPEDEVTCAVRVMLSPQAAMRVAAALVDGRNFAEIKAANKTLGAAQRNAVLTLCSALEQRRAENPKSRVRLLLVCADHPKENLKLEITFPPLGDGEEEVRTPRSRETGGASSSGSGAGSSGGAPSDEGEEAAAEEHSPGSPSGPWLVFRSARGSWSI